MLSPHQFGFAEALQLPVQHSATNQPLCNMRRQAQFIRELGDRRDVPFLMFTLSGCACFIFKSVKNGCINDISFDVPISSASIWFCRVAPTSTTTFRWRGAIFFRHSASSSISTRASSNRDRRKLNVRCWYFHMSFHCGQVGWHYVVHRTAAEAWVQFDSFYRSPPNAIFCWPTFRTSFFAVPHFFCSHSLFIKLPTTKFCSGKWNTTSETRFDTSPRWEVEIYERTNSRCIDELSKAEPESV